MPRPYVLLLAASVLLGAAAVVCWFQDRSAPAADVGAARTHTPPARDLTLDGVRAAFASADPARIQPALADLGRRAPLPTAWLLDGLAHADRGVREWSAHALGDFAPQAPGVVDALLKAFTDEDDWVRWKAARALGRLRAPKALAALRVAAEADQETEVVRAAAQKAVAQIESAERD